MVSIAGPSRSLEPSIDEQASRQVVNPARSSLESIRSMLPSFNSSEAHGAWPSNIPIPQDPIVVGMLSAIGGGVLVYGALGGYRRYWRRIRNSNDVTQKMLDSQKWIKGRVTSVGDGDNFRLYHTPGIFYSYPFKIRRIPTAAKDLKDQTLHIRISGVDAPENAHFGNPSQPHAKESLEWLRSTITGKKMKVRLLRKDQYNRIVALPYIHRTFLPNKPLPVMMLKEGMAVVYESSGAEYGPWGLAGLKKLEAQAKAQRKGLWKARKLELPGDYKKRMKAAEEGRVEVRIPRTRPGGWWGTVKRILGIKK